ncbi:hypothetical protein [Streptomyces olivochromogenes]|uniref:hypothetical protein n=1 Tax=Streptomyces olivochromogenes TaxID=1963 RepID=UPI0035AEB9D0
MAEGTRCRPDGDCERYGSTSGGPTTDACIGRSLVAAATSAGSHRHISLPSCGSQATSPVLHALARHSRPHCIEVVSTVASASPSPATRRNLDQFIVATQAVIRSFIGSPEAMLVGNLSSTVVAAAACLRAHAPGGARPRPGGGARRGYRLGFAIRPVAVAPRTGRREPARYPARDRARSHRAAHYRRGVPRRRRGRRPLCGACER